MSRRILPPGKSAVPDERLRSTAARNVLIEQWKELPGFVVLKKMRNSSHVRKIGIDEAIQVGFLALVRAAELWDESRGIQFNTYAVRSIMVNVITAGLTDGVIHIPHHLAGPAGRQYRYYEEAEAAHLFAELPEWLPSAPPPEPKNDYGPVLAAMARLPAKLAFVVKRRTLEGAVLSKIGGELGVSKERIRQLYNEGIRLLQLSLGVAPCLCKRPYKKSPRKSKSSAPTSPRQSMSAGTSSSTSANSAASPSSVPSKQSPLPRKTRQLTTAA